MADHKDYPFHSFEEEAERHKLDRYLTKKHIPAYTLAFLDQEFLLRRELRSVRLQLEYLKAEMTQIKEHIDSTIVIFGSSRILPPEEAAEKLKLAKEYAASHPGDPQAQTDLQFAQNKYEKSAYYEEARRFAKIVSTSTHAKVHGNFIVMTGGGPGIMEAANRGASEADGKSIGLSIYLPTEEGTNKYITPELHLQFHYFAMRKMHFLSRARALVVFPGGYGTLDELFEALTLLQTKKMKRIPVILVGEKYWRKIINFQALVEEDAITAKDLTLFQFVETAEEAWRIITNFYSVAN